MAMICTNLDFFSANLQALFLGRKLLKRHFHHSMLALMSGVMHNGCCIGAPRFKAIASMIFFFTYSTVLSRLHCQITELMAYDIYFSNHLVIIRAPKSIFLVSYSTHLPRQVQKGIGPCNCMI